MVRYTRCSCGTTSLTLHQIKSHHKSAALSCAPGLTEHAILCSSMADNRWDPLFRDVGVVDAPDSDAESQQAPGDGGGRFEVQLSAVLHHARGRHVLRTDDRLP